MTEDYKSDLIPSVPLWRQIHDRFAARIADGSLEPGDPLPATAELAERFGVTVNTVQQGLDALRRRGLIDRTPGRGTFVSRRVRSRTIGVLFGRTVLTSVDDRFYLLLWGHLGRVARRSGWDLRLYQPVVAADAEALAEEIAEDARAGRVRGLIYLAEHPAIDRWIQEQPDLPWMGMRCCSVDYEAIALAGMRRLISVGIRSLALIPPDGHHGMRCRVAAEAVCSDAGASLLVLDHANTEAMGLRCGGQLAARAAVERPAGIVVCNDNACRGLIAALLMAGIRIPTDMSVVSHGNRGLAIFPGLDVSRHEVDVEDVASAMIEALSAVMDGESWKERAIELTPCKGTSVVAAK